LKAVLWNHVTFHVMPVAHLGFDYQNALLKETNRWCPAFRKH
jgi:hypothetical protein